MLESYNGVRTITTRVGLVEFLKPSPYEPGVGPQNTRPQVPITLLAPEHQSVELLRSFAADCDTVLIATDETLAFAGLLGLVRVGRALLTAADVTSRTPGCECCQIRVDLIDAVRHAVLRRSPPRRLVVVVDRKPPTGPNSLVDDDSAIDVVTVIHTLQADSEIERLAYLDGLVVEVDACAASTRLACGLDLWTGPREAAIAVADRIVVNGSELLTTAASAQVSSALQIINRIGKVVCGQSAAAHIEDLVDLDAWNGHSPACLERTAGPGLGPVGMVVQVTHAPNCRHHAATVGTIVLTRRGVLDPDATDAWLDRVVAESPSRLLRFQAALCVSTCEPRVCVRGSRSAMRSQPEGGGAEGTVEADQSRQESVVILVGRALDHQSLAESFETIELAQ